MARKRSIKSLVDDAMHGLSAEKLDGRTRRAKRLKQMQNALVSDFSSAAEAILLADLAINSSLQMELTDFVFKKGIVSKDGTINGPITKHIEQLQRSNREAIKALSLIRTNRLKAEGHDNDNESKDPGSLILDVISCDDESDD